jgi:hypothetical protein
LAVSLGLAVSITVSGAEAASMPGLQAQKTAFTPHRALYRMELGSSTQGSDVVDASGTMFYRFEPLCDGWEVESRVALRLHYGSTGAAPEVVETTWTFTSFESYDGTDFTYAVDHKRNGLVQEAFAGEAGKDDMGGGASFNDEEFTSVNLPVGTLFPAEHLMRLLAHARHGNGPFKRVVFDRASIDNPYEVNAFVVGLVHDGALMAGNTAAGPEKTPAALLVGASSAAGTAGLTTGGKIWRVRMAYFPMLAVADLPDFELEVDYRDDGIAERMIQDFGDFTLNLTPSRLEVLPPPECK